MTLFLLGALLGIVASIIVDVWAGQREGWLVADGSIIPRYRTLDQGCPSWTTEPHQALRFARRDDAELFAAEDEDAWRILPYRQCV